MPTKTTSKVASKKVAVKRAAPKPAPMPPPIEMSEEQPPEAEDESLLQAEAEEEHLQQLSPREQAGMEATTAAAVEQAEAREDWRDPFATDVVTENIERLAEAVAPSRLTMQVLELLSRPFEANALSLKFQAFNGDRSKGMVVAFIDARDVMQRLDAVVGGDWSDRYRAAPSGGLECALTVCGVTRCDVGDDKNDNEQEKSSYSDALKRAAVKFGIGRYLYSLPNWWVATEGDGKNKRIPAGEETRIRNAIMAASASEKPAEKRAAAPKAVADMAIAYGRGMKQSTDAEAVEHPDVSKARAASQPAQPQSAPKGNGAVATALAKFSVTAAQVTAYRGRLVNFLKVCPEYAQPNNPGVVDDFHLRGAFTKAGYPEVNDDNWGQALEAVYVRAKEKRAEKPAPKPAPKPAAARQPARAAQPAAESPEERMARLGF